MNNCKHNHQHGENCTKSNCNHGHCKSHGENMHGGGCAKNGGQGKGKKRELFLKKYNEYLSNVDLPSFDSDEAYHEWTLNTEEGKIHLENIKRINAEIDEECPWGGKRDNAGRRKECIRKIPYTRRLSTDILEKLKQYAQEQGISETEAIEKAISNL